jgi:hypothetical protein
VTTTSNLTIDDLTEMERDSLTAQGRIQDGKVLPPPAPASPQLKPDEIPPMPPGVRERLAAAKQLQSGMVHEREDGKTVTFGAPAAPKPDPVQPAQADRVEFLAHLLGAHRFQKTYRLFGAIEVTFQTRLASETAQCAQQVLLDEKRDGALAPIGSQTAAIARTARTMEYMFVGAIEKLGPVGSVQSYSPYSSPSANLPLYVLSIRSAHDEFKQRCTQPLWVALWNQWLVFEELVLALTVKANDPDFWTAEPGT